MKRFLAVWLATAVAFVGCGGLRLHPPPFPQLVAASLVALLVLACASSRLRSAVGALPLQALVAFHLTRFVGFYFLVLHEQGRLPYAFAVLGGWGDILVAAGAALLLFLDRRWSIPSGVWQAWNLFGLVDIVFVVLTAARLGRIDPGSMQPLLELPLGLLPTFVVPIILFTHLVLLLRLRRAPA